ncbi:L-seryl-tRNA(Sec) selenium transferase [Aquibacillus kalidii]|uniref:L-seryl-tRNA(Sec) selenium transferase n=1 Tax=Aquibacillus kalidii TaxID=2762597 RepID=UPI001648F339|nr:L-seryl-tRNA(Sec) selenium transferase [Aquibacillus kalidii]
MKQLLREIPPVHELQNSRRFKDLIEKTDVPVKLLTKVIQQVIDEIRTEILDSHVTIDLSKQSFIDYIWMKVENNLSKLLQERLTPVINATGTVLHTNLGRARLSDAAIEHITHIAGNYSNLEYNIDEGKRGSRHDILEGLLKEVTGAEAAMAVNNNAAAVYLVLRALAKEQEVIVSRGQLVEIGGSFRISSIMEESGARLVEVGTTNKTHLYDYENAISDETAMILKVHTSNFKTIGFTESVDTEDLVALKNEHNGLIFYEDLGSGSIYDFKQVGVGEEPVVKDVIESGVDLVSFSGDKLLGGPQAGIIVGKKELIQKLKKHQLARVLRVDKMTFAGLEKTLLAYLTNKAEIQLPTIRDIVKPLTEIEQQSHYFISELKKQASEYESEVVESTSQVGGGTMPDVTLPTIVVVVSHHAYSAEQLGERLRHSQTANVIARIKDEKILIDFRTISQEETDILIQTFVELLK